MKVKSNRQVYRIGFVDILHKETGKKIPVSAALIKNKARMMQLGYVEIVKPETPSMTGTEKPVLEIVEPENPVNVIEDKKWKDMNGAERKLHSKKLKLKKENK